MASTTTTNTSTPAASDRPAAAMTEPGNPGAAAGAGGGAAPSSVHVAATTCCAFCTAGENMCLAPDNKCTITPVTKTKCCYAQARAIVRDLQKVIGMTLKEAAAEVERFYNPQLTWQHTCPCYDCYKVSCN